MQSTANGLGVNEGQGINPALLNSGMLSRNSSDPHARLNAICIDMSRLRYHYGRMQLYTQMAAISALTS
jgi:hypothetical protein